MRYAAVTLIGLVVTILVVWVVLRVVRSLVERAAWWHASRRPWEIDEGTDDGFLTVYAVKPYEDPIALGSVLFVDPEFEFLVEGLRADARAKVVALNNGRRA